MAKGNFREYLKTDMVRAKKYFYVIRPILACRWILEDKVQTLPYDKNSSWEELNSFFLNEISKLAP